MTATQIPAMKLNYFPETDSLYIDLAQKPSVEKILMKMSKPLSVLRPPTFVL